MGVRLLAGGVIKLRFIYQITVSNHLLSFLSAVTSLSHLRSESAYSSICNGRDDDEEKIASHSA